jgi:hypothetical protein
VGKPVIIIGGIGGSAFTIEIKAANLEQPSLGKYPISVGV